MPAKILIADDETSIRTVLKKALAQEDLILEEARHGQEAWDKLSAGDCDVALLDIRMPFLTGLEILQKLQGLSERPQVIILTAQDTMTNAVEAMKQGAFDYLAKPFDVAEVSVLVTKAIASRNRERKVSALREAAQLPADPLQNIVGQSRAIKEIYKMIGKLADQEVSVLITGESGTGKELVARAIHLYGRRAPYPFVAINCSAIPEGLLESELFGHTKGSFTGAIQDRPGLFERAHRGTLFLDEIGDIPLVLQSKLLRALQEREVMRLGEGRARSVDVRVIAASNCDLCAMVDQGKFREDLYFRLNVVPMKIPALKDRREDIPILADYFLRRCAERSHTPLKAITKAALKRLESFSWPGNVRELENVIQRAVVFAKSMVIDEEDFIPLMENLAQTSPQWGMAEVSLETLIATKLDEMLSKLGEEKLPALYLRMMPLLARPLITLVLKKTRGNQLKAASLLGLNRNTLRKKIRELGIQANCKDQL